MKTSDDHNEVSGSAPAVNAYGPVSWPVLLTSVFFLGWCGGQFSELALVNGNLCQNILYYNRGIFNRLTLHSFSTALYISIKLILCD